SIAEFPEKFLTVLPGNSFNWKIVTHKHARIVTHDRMPAGLVHGMDCQVKALAQRYLVLDFTLVSPFFIDRTAHQESSSRNPGELHAQAVRDEWSDWLHSGSKQTPQTVFQFTPLRNNNCLGERVQQTQQFGTGIATLFEPVGKDQTQFVFVWMFLQR